ncbi:hypothetical protein [Blastopirellula marina]|uniref:Uncharacterized protein n=1 Tax=Blastopirellula marina TaxID=124 RepID=A0A2S8GRP3_9BACT|nr:hypothetical protein [Blastopirellula marina]PQO46694.1 hypothetical protein C5Y93_07620 [Blastopirellula marina]
MNLEEGAGLSLDVTQIPESLHGLIPLVERWGFRSQTAQDDFVIAMKLQHPEQVAAFNARVDDARDAIISWGNGLKELDKPINEIAEEFWSHPYWSFLALLKIRELTEPEDSPIYEAARKETALEIRRIRFSTAVEAASSAFRDKEYRQFVDLLEPFEDMLTDVQSKKLEFARSRLS